MCFEQILDFLNNYSYIIAALGAAFSAGAAICAVFFSIFIHIKTRSLLKPTERPIISIKRTTAKTKRLLSPVKGISFKLIYTLKNVGKHPSINLRIRTATILKDNLEKIDSKIDKKIVNIFVPDFEFNFTQQITKISVEKGKAVLKNYELYTYLLLDYEDLYNPGKRIFDEHWFFYVTGMENLTAITNEEKELIESLITAEFPDRKQVLYQRY
jgi:hypothetical protein